MAWSCYIVPEKQRRAPISSYLEVSEKRKEYLAFFQINENTNCLFNVLGRIDDIEFEEAVNESGSRSSAQDILILAAKKGAARELYEETGLDFRAELDRLKPMQLRSSSTEDLLFCELKHRLFFRVIIQDEDFPDVSSS